jgi:hypothetical protein
MRAPVRGPDLTFGVLRVTALYCLLWCASAPAQEGRDTRDDARFGLLDRPEALSRRIPRDPDEAPEPQAATNFGRSRGSIRGSYVR